MHSFIQIEIVLSVSGAFHHHLLLPMVLQHTGSSSHCHLASETNHCFT